LGKLSKKKWLSFGYIVQRQKQTYPLHYWQFSEGWMGLAVKVLLDRSSFYRGARKIFRG